MLFRSSTREVREHRRGTGHRRPQPPPTAHGFGRRRFSPGLAPLPSTREFAGFTPPPRLAEDGVARFELVISSQALSHETFSRLFNEWRRRNAPAGVRLLELRDLTRQRGRELHRLAQARARPAARPRPATPARPATPVSPTPRNAPCPCGSGLKHKRCCGK